LGGRAGCRASLRKLSASSHEVRQKSALGINRELMRSPKMVVKTWSRYVMGTAPAQVVPPVVPGTEKKYCELGVDPMSCIVWQSVIVGVSLLQFTFAEL